MSVILSIMLKFCLKKIKFYLFPCFKGFIQIKFFILVQNVCKQKLRYKSCKYIFVKYSFIYIHCFYPFEFLCFLPIIENLDYFFIYFD